ncbi:PR domain zinc finger protein 15 [Branchiostoma belcheri]|nr:PR domain zinc finger protein 15 [Branchiostoma belcheri]
MAEMDRYWCDFCGTYEDDIVCPNLGPVQTMQDSEVQSRARASLPKGLVIQNTTDGQEGVFAGVPLSARMKFGPLEAQRLQTAPQGMEPFPLKVFSPDGSCLYLDTTNEEVCNWMKFVRPATRDTEQNLLAYQQGTNIFFLTQKDIPVGGELRVWYAPSYAKKMGQHLQTPGGEHLLTAGGQHLPTAGGQHLPTPGGQYLPTAGGQHLQTPGAQQLMTPGGQQLQTSAGQLSQGAPSLAVTHGKGSVPAPVQTRTDKHSTTSTVHQTDEQEGTRNCMNLSSIQSESQVDDFQQSKTVTRWNVQENIIKRAKQDPQDKPRIVKGKGRGQPKVSKTCKKKIVPDSKRVTKAKDVSAKPRREKTQILCAGCTNVFEDEDVLKEHIEKEHPDKEEQGRKRPRRSTVKSHFCQICQDSFAKNSELLFHCSTCHAGQLKCTEPNSTRSHTWQESDDESNEWNDNEESMSDEEPAVATKRRKQNGGAKKRKKRAKKDLEYNLEHAEQMWCVYCDATFSSPCNGKQHSRVAHGLMSGVERKFKAKDTSACQHCSAPFCSPIKLKAHVLSLHGPNKKPYKCDTCQTEFSLAQNLQDHLKQAGGTCKLHCQDCDENFTSLATARVHQQLLHPPTSQQTVNSPNGKKAPRQEDLDAALRWCKYCDLAYQSSVALKAHMTKYHGAYGLDTEAFSGVLEHCHLCNAPFTFHRTLRSHLHEVHKVFPDFALQKGSTISPVHECERCCQKFPGPAQLQLHLEERMGECTMSCQQCGKSFCSLPSLRLHEAHKHSMVKCNLCRNSFVNVQSLGRHIKKVHQNGQETKSDSPEWCQYCDISFAERKSFNRHMKVYHGAGHPNRINAGNDLKLCSQCDAPFTSTKSMLKHVQDIHGVYTDTGTLIPQNAPKTHKCPTCSKVLSGPQQLQAHLAERNGQCRMTCEVCGQKFDSLPLFRSHKDNMHHSVKKCKLCEATFKNSSGLGRHMRNTHSSDSNAMMTSSQRWCPYCDQTFVYSTNFSTHMREFHYPSGYSLSSNEPAGVTDDLPHCEVCDAPFSTLRLLKRHVLKAHELPAFTKGQTQATHQCETCCQTFRGPQHLDNHLRSGQGKCRATCPWCHEAFYRLASVRVHEVRCSKRIQEEPEGQQSSTSHKDTPAFKDTESIVLATLEQQWCSHCDLVLSAESALSKHMTEFHGEGSAPEAGLVYCKTCNSPFTDEAKLLSHSLKLHNVGHTSTSIADLASHTPSSIQCGSCQKCFSSVQGLEEHLMARNHACLVDCKTCGLQFSSILRLRWHEYRTHANTEEEPQPERGEFVCDVCSSFFDTSESLADHLSGHAGQDVYQCTVCSKPQPDNAILKHVLAHEDKGSQDFICPGCTQTFDQKDALLQHLQTHKLSKYACPLCKSTVNNVDWTSHLEEECSAKEQKHRCPLCTVVCQSVTHLCTHMKQCEMSTDKTFFSCDLCKIRFTSKAALRRHQALQHSGPGQSLGCPQCEYSTQDSKYQLWKHFTEHDLLTKLCEAPKDDVESTSVTCTLCGTRMPEKGLSYHLKKHKTVEYMFKCRFCPGEFFTARQLHQHTDKHIYKDGKEMTYRKSYENHLSLHKGDIVLEARVEIQTRECDICGKCFSGQTQMQRHREEVHMNHISIHLNIKKHACNLCGKAFNQKVNLKKHLESHNDSKQFQCEACGKTFQHSDSLRTHMRLRHLDHGKSCRFCGKKFLRTSVLKLHENAVHNGIKTKMCQVCGQVLTYEHTLRRHVRRVHPDLYDKYYPASVAGQGNSGDKTVVGNLGRNAGQKTSARQGKKRGRKDHFQISTQEHTLSQHLTVSAEGSSTAQNCEEEEEILCAIDGVVTDNGDMNKDTHTTVIIINDQNSTEQNIVSSVQLAEGQASTSAATSLGQWMPRQFQGSTEASSCEIIMPSADAVRYVP